MNVTIHSLKVLYMAIVTDSPGQCNGRGEIGLCGKKFKLHSDRNTWRRAGSMIFPNIRHYPLCGAPNSKNMKRVRKLLFRSVEKQDISVEKEQQKGIRSKTS